MTLKPDGSIGSVPDPTKSELRTAIAAIERDLAGLPHEPAADGAPSAADRLRASVAELVRQLALGPEPEYRVCPVCRHIVMRAATVCGHCWSPLTPPLPADRVGR